MSAITPRLLSALRRRVRPKLDMELPAEADLIEMAHWVERDVLRLHVPTELLRMQGGFVYGDKHPFVQALKHGKSALEAFYSEVQPKNLCDYYGVRAIGRVGEDLPPWELPWYSRKERLPPPGELGLGREHGVSFFGPATSEKIDLEYRRLNELRASIEKNGYDPDGHSDIEGVVMRSGKRSCFFVRGGKHRAAALASLGETTIPVSFRRHFPRLIDRAQSRYWPLVRSGTISRSLAKEILAVIVQGRDVELAQNE